MRSEGWAGCWSELGSLGGPPGAAGRLPGRLASAGMTFTKSSPFSVSSAFAEWGSTMLGSWILCSTGTCGQHNTHTLILPSPFQYLQSPSGQEAHMLYD